MGFATVRIPTSLFEAAREAGTVMSRSIAGQLQHWAMLGRAVEEAPGFGTQRIRAALGGALDPGVLSEDERAIFDDLFAQRLADHDDSFSDLVQPGAVGYVGDVLMRVNANGVPEPIGK